MSALRLAIAGCTGRTGGAVLRLAAHDPEFQVVAALTHPEDPRLGQDAALLAGRYTPFVPITALCDVACDVLIEFTTPEGCRTWAKWCAAQRVPLVSGTTGLADADRAALNDAARAVAVLWSPNMSVGVNLLLRLVAEAATLLTTEWDVEIVETHHRHKVDAPSGTAQALLEAVHAARGADSQAAVVHGRSGRCGPRKLGEIGVHALRLGENVGEHEVYFASAAETLMLQHRALSRDTFAAGALRAARWIAGRPPGLYHMRDVLAVLPMSVPGT